MADNYTQFSFDIDKLTVEEGAWLRTLLALDFEDEQHRQKIKDALGVPNIIESEIEYWPDFSFRLDATQGPRPKGAIWLYTEDSGNPYNAALLLRAFLAKFRPKDIKLPTAWHAWFGSAIVLTQYQPLDDPRQSPGPCRFPPAA